MFYKNVEDKTLNLQENSISKTYLISVLVYNIHK